MTVDKLKTAIANIEGYLSMSHDEDDTVTLTVNVIRSIKENYEELIEAKAEIERLKKGWKADVIETSNIKAEVVKEFAERIRNSAYESEVVAFIGKVYMISETAIKNAIKETAGESDADV